MIKDYVCIEIEIMFVWKLRSASGCCVVSSFPFFVFGFGFRGREGNSVIIISRELICNH